MKRISLKQFVFLIPLLLFIAVFSVYPIVTSCLYSFFDYRTNDQQKNKFYTNEQLNVSLLVEDLQYINYYLNTDLALTQGMTGKPVVSDEDKAEMTELMNTVSATMEKYDANDGVRAFKSGEKDELEALFDDIESKLNAFYNEKYPDAEFFNRENTPIIMENLRTAVVESNYIGGSNYSTLIKDTRFWKALAHTLIFMFCSVALEFCLGMCLALIMNKAMTGIGLVRTIGLIPWAIPTAVSALMWSYMYDGSFGIISKILSDIGLIGKSTDMLLTSTGAMASAIFADVWKTTPYMALLLLAGLQNIDRGLYEASAIDGCGPVKNFFQITLPLMKSSIMVALLFRTLDSFRVYDLIAILTNGGPGNGTETLSVYAYKLMFGQSNYGYGSTVVIGMFVCVAIIAIFYVKVLGAEVISND